MLDRFLASFRERPPRERVLLGVASGSLISAMLWLGLVNPMISIAEESTQRIETADQQLRAMRHLRIDFDAARQQLTDVESKIQTAPRGNLRTALESLAKEASLNIDSMEPQTAPTHPVYTETKVEVGLHNVTLSQVINYLHRIETAEQVYSIKSLRIKTRPDRSEMLDVNFTVSSFEPI